MAVDHKKKANISAKRENDKESSHNYNSECYVQNYKNRMIFKVIKLIDSTLKLSWSSTGICISKFSASSNRFHPELFLSILFVAIVFKEALVRGMDQSKSSRFMNYCGSP